jgi:hypothetical protein
MRNTLALAVATFAFVVSAPDLMAQTPAPAEKSPSASAKQAQKSARHALSPQELNTQEYIKLLRENVRSEKSRLVGQVMQLDGDDSVKFWPIYQEYDAELAKVNDMRVANIHEYAQSYTQMTDDKADQLVHNAMEYQKLRGELLAKYYGKMKDAVGAINAARFVQVEHQLLLIIDLQVDSELPVVGS